MEQQWYFLIGGLIAGGVIAWLLATFKVKGEKASLESVKEILERNEQELKGLLSDERNKNQVLQNDLAAGEQNFANLSERLETKKEETEALQKQFTERFENLANKILEEKSQKFTEQNKESIGNLLNPLKEKISTFEQKVEKTHNESIDRHAALRQQIIGLQELNMQISQEALNLTKALKGDSKLQGNWGELVLERILEKSGLEKGREYEVQQSFQTEEGVRQVPDVIIHLPDGKKMIVDSKVSLKAYEQLVNTEDAEEKEKFRKLHQLSMKTHIDSLGEKNYHDIYKTESPDMILMFVPIEPAWSIAAADDNSLYDRAFTKKIVIVTASTLLATLKTIDSIWTNEKQQRFALDIATEAGKMYDQFVNLLSDLEKVGNQIGTVQKSYESSMKKLTGKGNVLTKIEKLKKLGAKANKEIPKKWLDKTDEE